MEIVDEQLGAITQLFDIKNGGFGTAPKFPHPSAADLILERYRQTGEKHLLAMAETTLEKMALGRRLRPTGRWISSLLGGRTLARAALRKNELRQFGTTEELRAWVASDRQTS